MEDIGRKDKYLLRVIDPYGISVKHSRTAPRADHRRGTPQTTPVTAILYDQIGIKVIIFDES